MDKAGLERCQFLFTDLLQKTRHGSVPTGPCIAAAEAGASCLAEIERLQAVLRDIASNEYAGYGGIGGIARAALRPYQQSESKDV